MIEDFRRLLRSVGLEPRTVGYASDKSSQAPLVAIRELLSQCHGVVVLAYERTYAPLAINRPDSPRAETVHGLRIPTVWNQIEGAMGYIQGVPLMVVAQDGLRLEGMINRYDWWLHQFDAESESPWDDEAEGRLADFARRVRQSAEKSTADVTAMRGRDVRSTASIDGLTVKDLMGSITVKQAWATGGALVALASGLAVLAYTLGAAGALG